MRRKRCFAGLAVRIQRPPALPLVRSNDKRKARLNVISHILKTIPYKKVKREKVRLPKRTHKGRYDDQASLRRMKFVEERY